MEKYKETLEFNRFGLISLLLIVVTCVSGFAAAFALDNMFMLVPVVLSTMAVETLILAVQPMVRIVKASILSLFISFVVILTTLLALG
jgi:hypothetical protein